VQSILLQASQPVQPVSCDNKPSVKVPLDTCCQSSLITMTLIRNEIDEASTADFHASTGVSFNGPLNWQQQAIRAAALRSLIAAAA